MKTKNKAKLDLDMEDQGNLEEVKQTSKMKGVYNVSPKTTQSLPKMIRTPSLRSTKKISSTELNKIKTRKVEKMTTNTTIDYSPEQYWNNNNPTIKIGLFGSTYRVKNEDETFGKILNRLSPKYLLLYHHKQMADDIETASKQLGLIKNPATKEHWDNYLNMIIQIREMIWDLTSPNQVLGKMLEMSKDSNVRYIVSDIDIKIEFRSGRAEAYRQCIQSLNHWIEKCIISGHFTMDPITKKLFEMSPFCYDNEMYYDAIKFDLHIAGSNYNNGLPKRKNYRAIKVGQELFWD